MPLIASFRIGNKGADKEGLSRSGLYIVLHTFLEEVANDVRKKNPRDAAKLLGSSLHWLRHTFAVASLEVMPVNVRSNSHGTCICEHNYQIHLSRPDRSPGRI